MLPDSSDIRNFLSRHHPFDLLPPGALGEVASAVTVAEVPRGTLLMRPGEPANTLFVVRRGAVETRTVEGQLLARLGEGDVFGVRAILRGGKAVNRSEAIEDSRLYCLPAAVFQKLRAEHPTFAYFFATIDGSRPKDPSDGPFGTRSLDVLTRRVGDLLARGAVTLDAASTVADAARLMRRERVSSVLVTEAGRLAGIFTDRDLRSRVVAEELPYATPVADAMTPNPLRVRASDQAFDALLMMSRHNIHHLPVVADDGEALKGCLTGSALIESHTASPLFVARGIHGCGSVEELRDIVATIPGLVNRMAEAGGTAEAIGRVTAILTDAVTTRLIALAEAALGPPPVPYAWLAAGSQGRQEQTALSDQDNALLLDDSFSAAVHGTYFENLARTVCDGLNACGYVYCPGEMMAMNANWRLTLSQWKETFRRWIDQPEPKALMLLSVFFDLRPVHGPADLFDVLQTTILERTAKNRIFQAHMARNALTHEPPIGFFRNFVLVRGGDHHHTLDLKHRGVAPIIDLARVYALAAGVRPVNTFDRLAAAADAGTLSRDGVQDLTDALEFVALTRLRHQARMIREGQKADNFLAPEELSGFERNHLKAAFAVVKTMQGSMANTYQAGRF